MSSAKKKTIGQAIDDVIAALESVDDASRITVVRAACEHLGISGPTTDSQQGGTPIDPEVTPVAPLQQRSPEVATDIRSLRTQKSPKTDHEMVCIVAYYLDSLAPPNERKKNIGRADVEKYFKQAGHKLPKRLDQVLVNAKSAGYLDSAGRGKYKLNPVGHNLVVHTLPRSKS